MTITLYGIPNCDTVKKARVWLQTQGIEHVFHDFKKAGITRDMVQTWLLSQPWDVLVNRKGTTWRALPDERKAAIIDAESATALLLEAPSIVKRPVLATTDGCQVGFSDALYQQIFKNT